MWNWELKADDGEVKYEMVIGADLFETAVARFRERVPEAPIVYVRRF